MRLGRLFFAGMKSWISPKAKVSSNSAIYGKVFINEEVVIEPRVSIRDPAFIGKGAHIKSGSYMNTPISERNAS